MMQDDQSVRWHTVSDDVTYISPAFFLLSHTRQNRGRHPLIADLIVIIDVIVHHIGLQGLADRWIELANDRWGATTDR